MLNSSYYKGNDILKLDKRYLLKGLTNLYEYNFESTLKDRINMDIEKQRSDCSNNSKIIKSRSNM